MDHLKRRQEIIDRFKTCESVKQSPMHASNLASGEPTYSERPVAFLCDDEILVVGDCVGKLYAGLKKFIAVVDGSPESWSQRAAREPWVGQAIAKTKKQLAIPEPTELRVTQQIWNGYMFAMQEVGLLVVLTDGTYPTPLE
jgi:hypothetical protein